MIGRQLAHFEIIDLLGEGGMGVVYRALDRHLGRQVALKILPADKTANAARRDRFVQEARAASALNHPNIVTIYDISAADGVDYIAMELVAGRTLEDLLARQRLKLQEALKYAVQIADALGAAHAAGIVHRDLKPANVMVTEAGVVKVLDFGLAKLTQQADPSGDDQTRTQRVLTEERTIVGSAAYMSPEQAEGRSVDARSDIFSFGLVLYEMFSGRRALAGATRMATIAAIVSTDPTPLSQVAPDLPKELDRIITRCLRKDLSRRSQSIAEIKVALDELKEESESGAIGGLTPVPHSRRLRLVWPAIGIGVLLLAAATAIGLARWREQTPVLEETPLTSYAGFQGAPTLSPDGTQFAFIWSGGKGALPQLYVRPIDAGTPLQLTSTPGTFVTSPAWSPDGQTIAFVRTVLGQGVGQLTLIPALGGRERVICEASSGSRVAWSPDGSRLYFAARAFQQTVAIFTVPEKGGSSERVTSPPPDTFGDIDPAPSPDGRQLVFVRRIADFNNDLLLAKLQDGKILGVPRALTAGHLPATRSPVWLPDGASVLYTSGDFFSLRGIYRVSVSGGTPIRVPLVGGDYAGGVALTRSGNRLVYDRAFQDYNMYRVQLLSDGAAVGPKTQFGSSSRFEESPTFSPDGKRLLFGSNRDGLRQIYVADADGSNPISLTSFSRGALGSAKWSPDGERVVFDARPDGLADVYSMKADGSDLKRLTDNPAEDHVPCYSADGRWIYFASTRSGPRQLYRMPAVGGEAVRMTRNGSGAMASIASPDGKWIYFSKEGGGLWKIPADGGDEIPVLSPNESPGNFTFTVSRAGIYYAGPLDSISRSQPLRLQHFADGTTVDAMTFDRPLRLHFSVSADEKWFAWTQLDSNTNELVIIRNFR